VSFSASESSLVLIGTFMRPDTIQRLGAGQSDPGRGHAVPEELMVFKQRRLWAISGRALMWIRFGSTTCPTREHLKTHLQKSDSNLGTPFVRAILQNFMQRTIELLRNKQSDRIVLHSEIVPKKSHVPSLACIAEAASASSLRLTKILKVDVC